MDKVVLRKAPVADSRTCDYANVTKEQLLEASRLHIQDVGRAMSFFVSKMLRAAVDHDYDKLTEIDHFLSDFHTGFKETGWHENHKRIHRHHLNYPEGVPDDVDLIDILEYIADCVSAGMARKGSVYPVEIDPEVLMRAFKNTGKKLEAAVVVVEPEPESA